MMSDEIIPHSFRSTVQQLVSDCDRQANSAVSSGLLNRVESTLSIVEEGFNLLSASPLFSVECNLLSTFRSSLARCVRTLQYGQNDCTVRGLVTLIASVLRSATTVKTKVNGQIEIFAIVNGQVAIFL